MTHPAILTQQQLIARLREELGIHASSSRVHAWIHDGMPLAPKGGKKPRFVWDHVRAWLIGQSSATTPASQQIRDHLFRSSCRRKGA